MLRIGVSLSPTKTKFGPLLFAGDLFPALEQVKAYGYDGIELSLLDSQKIDQDQIMEELERLGLGVFAIATGQTYVTDGYCLYSGDDGKRTKSVERLYHHIDFAAKLDSAVIVGGIRGRIEDGCKNPSEVKEKGHQAVADCARYAEQKNVVLLIEPVNRYETNVINTVEEGLELIRSIDSKQLKLLPDTFHMNIEERSIEDSIIQAGDDLGYIHFADSNRLAAGLGHLDFSSIVGALKKISFDGPIGVEVLPKPDDHAAAKQAIKFIKPLVGR
jgi:sugar phosphate isomerase/epimerase